MSGTEEARWRVGCEGSQRRDREWVSPPEDASLDASVMAGMGSGTVGLFITFEGLDGLGKSTQMELLAGALRERGYDVLTTREPGGTVLGEAVRRILLDAAHERMSPRAEALLYAAARAELVEQEIRPALNAGRIVLCDRYVDSSLAYQGFGRDLGVDNILTLNIWATEFLLPDLTFVLLAGESTRSERLEGSPDRVEAEGESFFARVENGYRRLIADHPHRIKAIDAEGAVEEVHARILDAVEQELRLLGR